jgi:hypothetical protein
MGFTLSAVFPPVGKRPMPMAQGFQAIFPFSTTPLYETLNTIDRFSYITRLPATDEQPIGIVPSEKPMVCRDGGDTRPTSSV